MTWILQSFGMWWRVVWYICTNITKEPPASIFRMEEDDNGDNRFLWDVSTTFGSGASDTLLWKCHASTTLQYPIVKPLCFIKHHTWRAYMYGSGGKAPQNPKHGTWCRWVVSFMPQQFTLQENIPSKHWKGDWVDIRSLSECICCPCQEPNHKCLVVQSVGCSLQQVHYLGSCYCLQEIKIYVSVVA